MLRTIAFVAGLAILVPPGLAQGVHLSGTADCGTWIEARSKKLSELLEHYSLGMLDTLSLVRQREFWESDGRRISREAVYLWLDGYCRDHPLEIIIVGITSLYIERSGWQPSD